MKRITNKLVVFLMAFVFLLSSCSSTKIPEVSPQRVDENHIYFEKLKVDEAKAYYSLQEVASYLDIYGHLPENYITKKEALSMGWDAKKGNLWDVTDKMVIGGDRFGNREGLLPKKKNRTYFEADIDYDGGRRNAKRLIYSNDGQMYYTSDHYKTFKEVVFTDEKD